jgi:hypothetical protein
MLGSTNAGCGGGSASGSEYRYGDRRECELCREVRRCFDRFDVTACQNCHSEFLPLSGVLSPDL